MQIVWRSSQHLLPRQIDHSAHLPISSLLYAFLALPAMHCHAETHTVSIQTDPYTRVYLCGRVSYSYRPYLRYICSGTYLRSPPPLPHEQVEKIRRAPFQFQTSTPETLRCMRPHMTATRRCRREPQQGCRSTTIPFPETHPPPPPSTTSMNTPGAKAASGVSGSEA